MESPSINLISVVLILLTALAFYWIQTEQTPKTKTYFTVMSPLDVITDENEIRDKVQMRKWLKKLKSAGVKSIMTDVWWGICEKEFGKFNFKGYKELFKMIEEEQLTVTIVFSFHKCGGNVGDDVLIELPKYVRESGFFYKDKKGQITDEYISLFYDNEKINGKTPIELYTRFMEEFRKEFEPEIQSGLIHAAAIGVGPCGEARYPAYRSGWVFPGVGALQCYDEQALLQAKDAGVAIPEEANEYNDSPVESKFWCNIRDNKNAVEFYNWYSQKLCDHTDVIMKEAKRILKDDVKLILKVPGIHWWSEHVSRACEANCGLYNYCQEGVYEKLIKICQSYGAEFSFTCLEMSHYPEAGSDPVGLINSIVNTCRKYKVDFGGENALECYTRREYSMLVSWRNKCHSFTFLRLGNEMMKFFHWRRFRWLVAHM